MAHLALAHSADRLAEATREWAKANLGAAEGGGGKGAVIDTYEIRTTVWRAGEQWVKVYVLMWL